MEFYDDDLLQRNACFLYRNVWGTRGGADRFIRVGSAGSVDEVFARLAVRVDAWVQGGVGCSSGAHVARCLGARREDPRP